jgi:hypothetical protein
LQNTSIRLARLPRPRLSFDPFGDCVNFGSDEGFRLLADRDYGQMGLDVCVEPAAVDPQVMMGLADADPAAPCECAARDVAHFATGRWSVGEF